MYTHLYALYDFILKTNLETNTTAIANGTRATQPAIFCIKIIGTIGRFSNFVITMFNEHFKIYEIY